MMGFPDHLTDDMSSTAGSSPQLAATEAASPPLAASRPISRSPPKEAEIPDLAGSVLSSQSVTARPRKIPIAPVFVRDAPRSPGGSTIRPVPIRLFGATEPEDNGEAEDKDQHHPGRDALARRPSQTPSQAGSTTVRPSSYAKLLHAYAQMVDQLGDSQPGSLTTLGPRSFLGIGAGPLAPAMVDELQVEWCILCGNPRDRQKMELRGFKPGEKGIGGESDPDGFWWFCADKCPKPLEELNRESRSG